MKKDYLKPEMDVMEITTESSMLSASPGGGDGDKVPVIPGEGVEGDFAGQNRGEWGNIWGK